MHLYFTRQLIVHFFLTLIILLIAYLSIDLIEHTRILASKIGWRNIIFATIWQIPFFVFQLLPVAFFIGSTLLLARLERTSQLEAFEILGINRLSLIFPVALIGVILALSMFLLNRTILPISQKHTNQYMGKYQRSRLSGESSNKKRWFHKNEEKRQHYIYFDGEQFVDIELENRKLHAFSWLKQMNSSFIGWHFDNKMRLEIERDSAPINKHVPLFSLINTPHENLNNEEQHTVVQAELALGYSSQGEQLTSHLIHSYPLSLISLTLALFFMIKFELKRTWHYLASGFIMLFSLWIFIASGFLLARSGLLSLPKGILLPYITFSILLIISYALKIVGSRTE